MIIVIALSLSVLVMLGGLYLLSKSKKDSLGNLYVFSSYSAIALGALMFAGTVVGGAMMRCNHGMGHKSCYVGSHHGSYGGGCGAASCDHKGFHGMRGYHGMMGKSHHGCDASCGDHGMKGHHGMKGPHGMKGHHGHHADGKCGPECGGECMSGNPENCKCPECPHKKGIKKKIIIEEIEDDDGVES